MSAPLVLAIDLGGTNIVAGVVDANGRILARTSAPTPVEAGRDAVLARMAGLGRSLLGKEVKAGAVGLGSPGIIDPATGTLLTRAVNIPGFENIGLASWLSETFGLPAIAGNDVNVQGLGESRWGCGRKVHSLFLIALGTGVGGALVVEGRLHAGAHGMAVEVGHMTMMLGGRHCACGRRGCLEAYVGSAGILQTYAESGTAPPPGALTVKDVFDRAHAGEEAALKTVDAAAEMLGAAVADLMYLLDVELFVFSGGITQAGDFLLDRIREVARRETIKPEWVRLEVSTLGPEAGLLGAAALAFGLLDQRGAG